MALLALLAQLIAVRVLVTILTGRGQSEECPFVHQLLIPTDVIRFDVLSGMTGLTFGSGVLALQCEPHTSMVKCSFVKVLEIKRSPVMLLVTIYTGLISQTSVIPCPGGYARLDLNVAIQTLCPHGSAPNLMT